MPTGSAMEISGWIVYGRKTAFLPQFPEEAAGAPKIKCLEHSVEQPSGTIDEGSSSASDTAIPIVN